MKCEPYSQKKSAPFSVWIARLFCVVIIGYVGQKWLGSSSPSLGGQFLFGGIVGISSLSFAASFFRLRAALIVVVLFVIAVPLVIFLMIDIFVLRGAWWEWLIMFPVQMGIPLALAFYLWRSPSVREYFSPSETRISSEEAS